MKNNDKTKQVNFTTVSYTHLTGIDFFAMISVDAKVMCIVKTAFVIPVAEPVQQDIFVKIQQQS